MSGEIDLIKNKFEPVYLKSLKNGQLDEKISIAKESLKACDLCPRKCGVDRRSEQTGFCKTGINAKISSFNAHFGEESPLVGKNGSGTIFFTHCSLLCNFCQNYDISHLGDGIEQSKEVLASIMLKLQEMGCHNINFVTPSHVIYPILSALKIAASNGLTIPLVYNTSCYDSINTIKLLDNVIDIYMPDFKFWSEKIAEKTCNAPDYPEKARTAIKEMYRQVGDLKCDNSGIAQRGLLVRHLVMPDNWAGTKQVMKFIAGISKNTYINIMPQYRPCGKADEFTELSRHITSKEFANAVSDAKNEGLYNFDKRRAFFFT